MSQRTLKPWEVHVGDYVLFEVGPTAKRNGVRIWCQVLAVGREHHKGMLLVRNRLGKFWCYPAIFCRIQRDGKEV